MKNAHRNTCTDCVITPNVESDELRVKKHVAMIDSWHPNKEREDSYRGVTPNKVRHSTASKYVIIQTRPA